MTASRTEPSRCALMFVGKLDYDSFEVENVNNGFVLGFLTTLMAACCGWFFAVVMMFELVFFVPGISARWLEVAGPAGAAAGVCLWLVVGLIERAGRCSESDVTHSHDCKSHG